MQGSSASPLGGTGGRDRLAESFGTSAQLWSQHERAKTSPSVFHRPSWRPCLRGATCQQSHPILPSGLNRKLIAHDESLHSEIFIVHRSNVVASAKFDDLGH